MADSDGRPRSLVERIVLSSRCQLCLAGIMCLVAALASLGMRATRGTWAPLLGAAWQGQGWVMAGVTTLLAALGVLCLVVGGSGRPNPLASLVLVLVAWVCLATMVVLSVIARGGLVEIPFCIFVVVEAHLAFRKASAPAASRRQCANQP